MTGFIAGFILASALAAGYVWAQQQDGYFLDQYGQFKGYTYRNQPQPQPDWNGPAKEMGKQLQRNPC